MQIVSNKSMRFLNVRLLRDIRLGLFEIFSWYNLFVTSKNETTNSPIHEFKVLHKGQSFKTPF